MELSNLSQMIYYSRKIMFIPTMKQRKFINHQLELILRYKKNLINGIFSRLFLTIQNASDGIDEDNKNLNCMKKYKNHIEKEFRDIFKDLYDQDKEDGAVYTSYEKLFHEIANSINSSIIGHQKFLKLSKLPYYEAFKNPDLVYANSFYLMKRFRSSEDHYLDSQHVYIPYLSFVRLKCKEGYFTHQDWINCYRISIKKDPIRRRYYVIFNCKTPGEDLNNTWSAQSSSKFRRAYIEKYQVPVAPSNLAGSQTKHYSITEIQKIRHNVYLDRRITSCFITKDFSFGVMSSDFANTSIFLDQNFSRFVMDDPNSTTLFDKIPWIKFCSFDVNFDSVLRKSVEKLNQVLDQISVIRTEYHDKTFHLIPDHLRYQYQKLLNKRKRIWSRISRYVETSLDQLIARICSKVPMKITVMTESYSLSRIPEIKEIQRYSIQIIHRFIRKLMSKCQLLQIPFFVINPDSKLLNVRKICPSCGQPTKLLGYHSYLPQKDFATFYRCTNPTCIFHNGFPKSVASISAFYSNIKFQDIMEKDIHQRLDLLNPKYLYEWYPDVGPLSLTTKYDRRQIHRFNPIYEGYIPT